MEPGNKAGTRFITRLRFKSRGGLALLALVGLSTLGHVIASFSRSTIVFLPDEYLYSELSRSLSSSGLPLVRGTEVFFPSLLQPLLTAPCWLVGSVETGFRASMVLDSIVMSLAALPVYWLGRRLGLSTWLALAASALTLATPSMLYSSWLMGEAIAYPLFLAGFAMGVLVLSGEKRWLIPALLVFALAALARIQLLVLPLAIVLAAMLMAAREQTLRRFLGKYRYLIGTLCVLAILAFVVPASFFGFYSGIRHIDLSPTRFILHFGTQAIALLFASAWIIVPGALLGLGITIFQPRSRVELAFACGAATVTLGLLLQASFFGVVTIPQERYVFYCAPVLALSLALLIDRGWPLRRAHALLLLPLLVLVARIPLSTYAAGDRLYQSSFLMATYKLELNFGVGHTTLLIAIVISVLALATIALPALGRLGGGAIFVLAIALSITALAISIDFDLLNGATLVREQRSAKGWIDKRIDTSYAGADRAVFLQGYSTRGWTLGLLFWNRSVDRVALLPNSKRPDILPWPVLKIGGDGALSVAGKPLTGPLVIDDTMQTFALRGAIRAGRAPHFTLWLPRGRPRFAFNSSGFGSGWMGPRASLALWPARVGGHLAELVAFRVATTRRVGPLTLTIALPDGAKRLVRLKPGNARSVRIAVCSTGPWHATITASKTHIRITKSGLSVVSARASAPVWRKDAAACTKAHSGAGG